MKNLFSLFCILIILSATLSGCSIHSQKRALPEASDAAISTPGKVSKTMQLTATSTITEQPEIIATAIPTMNPIQSSIIVEYGNPTNCGASGKQIFLLKPPYEEIIPLSGYNLEKDYTGASWSPNGQSIAYIESKPTIIKENATIPDFQNSNILIIDTNTTRSTTVNTPYPELYFQGINGMCDKLASLSHIVWNDDSNRIFTTYYDLSQKTATITITDLSTTNLQSISREYTILENFIWTSDFLSFITIESFDDVIKVFSIKNEQAILEREIKLPETIPVETYKNFISGNSFSPLMSDNKYVYLHIQSDEFSKTNYEAFWRLDLNTDLWEELIIFENFQSYRQLIFTNDWLVSCANEQLSFYNRENWQETLFSHNEQKGANCGSMTYFPAFDNKNSISFVMSDTKGNESLWVAQITPTNIQMQHIFSPQHLLSNYTSEIDTNNFKLLRYEWQPN